MVSLEYVLHTCSIYSTIQTSSPFSHWIFPNFPFLPFTGMSFLSIHFSFITFSLEPSLLYQDTYYIHHNLFTQSFCGEVNEAEMFQRQIWWSRPQQQCLGKWESHSSGSAGMHVGKRHYRAQEHTLVCKWDCESKVNSVLNPLRER